MLDGEGRYRSRRPPQRLSAVCSHEPAHRCVQERSATSTSTKVRMYLCRIKLIACLIETVLVLSCLRLYPGANALFASLDAFLLHGSRKFLVRYAYTLSLPSL